MDQNQFYDLLCCPACRGDLERRPSASELYCSACDFTYPILDGIPVLFPYDAKAKMDQLLGRYWDSADKAELYDSNVEGADTMFGTYIHESELCGIVQYYDPANLDVVLDAGCGNARFLETLPADTIKVGIDASLNLLRHAKRRGRADFLICGELEHLPLKDAQFGTVISCRVLQHLREQERAVREMARITRDRGDVILELYNTLNLKTVYKTIRMSPFWSRVFNAPFRMAFRSMSPFEPWGLEYDRYTSWFATKGWMKRAQLDGIRGRGVGFGYHKYFLQPFYIAGTVEKWAPNLMRRFYRLNFVAEQVLGGLIPLRYSMEKFAIKGTRGAPEQNRSLPRLVASKIKDVWKGSALYNATAIRETRREQAGTDVVERDHRFHLQEGLNWIKRAQDATPDRGVSRGYSVGWSPYFGRLGWQPSYPETSGYIIPTLFDSASLLGDDDLHTRAVQIADWEIDVQLDDGSVMGGTVDQPPSPAIFNTGQVMLGWLRAHAETNDARYLEAAERAARFLLEMQSADGAWRRGNSRYASVTSTTYNSRVGWAMILFGQAARDDTFVEAGVRNMEYTLTQQTGSGWFANNCLSDPEAPLLHTICYVLEGLLGSYCALGTLEYLDAVRRTVEPLAEHVSPEGRIPGQFDKEWNATVDWDCLTGNAQLVNILLTLASTPGCEQYGAVAQRALGFLKRTQNCVTEHEGLRGGVKGAYPFDGWYGRYEVLNWPTKFFLDALIFDDAGSRTTARGS